MLGRLGALTSNQTAREPRISNPERPPPPYDPNPNPSIIIAETTTTRTEVVTTTTTHFFSFPLWRKRPFVSASSPRESTSDPHAGADEHGIIPSSTRSSFLMVEKDLPPTPPHEDVSHRNQRKDLNETSPSGNSFSSLLSSDARTSSVAVDTLQPAAALARASLGLGLPHVFPHVSPSHSLSNNTTGIHPTPLHTPGPVLRKIKSAQRLKSMFLLETTSADTPLEDYTRPRGLSFSGSTLPHSNNVDTKGKGKERNIISARPSTSSTSSIARRASFWTRRKLTQEHQLYLAPPEPQTPQSSELPIHQPISPFNMNITVTPSSPSSSPEAKSPHSRSLPRSYSANSSLRSPRDTDMSPVKDRPPDQLDHSAPTSLSELSTSKVVAGSEEHVHDHGCVHMHEPQRRPRAQTNPPLLNRLSFNWLSSSSVSPPIIPRNNSSLSRPHTSSSTFSMSSLKGRQDSSPIFTESPNSSNSSRPSLDKAAIPLPSGKEESPEMYLRRLQAAVSKAEVASILASSPESFYAQVLRTYIGQFNFVEDPLDVALRKLLMEVGLPRETQQIDRVIEAFANRYLQCNPALYTSDDHPYILAFSLIMLHTDAFNKSNKRKMTKADYIKNTRLPGVAPEVLDCFYDNIVFAPFIFIEDPLDINGQRGLAPDTSSHSISPTVAGTPTSTGIPLARANKVDPYYLITHDLLGPLRVNVEAFVPKTSPYSYEGTVGPWDETQLQLAFAKANQIEVGASTTPSRTSSAFFNLGSSIGPASPNSKSGLPMQVASPYPQDMSTLKLTKLGLLNRKEDVLEGGKKASNRKWKQWSVVLTGSQLLFFRDTSWAYALAAQSLPSDGDAIFPHSALFKPDELLSVKNAIAVYDKSYTKYPNTFRFLLADGRQLLLQAPDEKELNEWIAGINYASAFKSAGVRMRPLEMSGADVKLTGVAAATSHLHDLQIHSAHSPTWDSNSPRDLMGMLSGDSETDVQRPPLSRRLTIAADPVDVELEVPIAPEIDGAEQFKATFDQVKADLAAGRRASADEVSPTEEELRRKSFDHSPASTTPCIEISRLPSRSQIMQSKITDLDLRIAAVQSQLDANLRFVRNIATLTPFQKSTRDRLTSAVQNVAQRVMQGRLEITKLLCHRNVLINDLVSEGRSWHRAKTLALRAATETLQSRHHTPLPRMTFSYHNSDSMDMPINNESLISQHLDASPTHRPESSICESFHSAVDFGQGLSSENTTTSFLDTERIFDSPPPSTSPSLNSHSLLDRNTESPRQSLNLPPSFQPLTESRRTSGDIDTQEHIYVAPQSPVEEEAEKWDRTRCAHRVSLVRLPSDIQLKSRFGRHGQPGGHNN